ncbi:hypothetical protein CMS1688 [Clavibacter sepedonicus]|uniref:Uncharacterized protein n=1 Tax=Clavibacter sepedonicus TaxID=31964 RepID=B0RCM9_CLASE|nr:hypothetical protein CMS1688 [Clavibacter sepedonicus]
MCRIERRTPGPQDPRTPGPQCLAGRRHLNPHDRGVAATLVIVDWAEVGARVLGSSTSLPRRRARPGAPSLSSRRGAHAAVSTLVGLLLVCMSFVPLKLLESLMSASDGGRGDRRSCRSTVWQGRRAVGRRGLAGHGTVRDADERPPAPPVARRSMITAREESPK